MIWWLLLGVGGLWAADRVFLGSGAGSSAPSFSNADIEKAVNIAMVKEKNPDRLTEFARVLQTIRPDLANELEGQAHKLALPLATALAVSPGAHTTLQPAAKFTSYKLTGH